MEDINAKRDARRRRILENSEKRLSKIAGRDSNNESEAIGTCYNLNSQRINSADVEDEIINSSISSKVTGLRDTSTQAAPSSLSLLTNRFNYIPLAAVVYGLFVLQLDRVFGKAITISYIPMMLSRLYHYKNMPEAQQSNLLYTVLILCNIRPEIIYRLKQFATLIHIILGDLAIYVFSFTLIHCVYSYCVYNSGMLNALKL